MNIDLESNRNNRFSRFDPDGLLVMGLNPVLIALRVLKTCILKVCKSTGLFLESLVATSIVKYDSAMLVFNFLYKSLSCCA